MSQSTLALVDKWHKTRRGYVAFSIGELALSYGFASWAINTGSLWQYALAIVLLIGGIGNFIRVFRAPKK